jgi:molybdopterin converting factor small subunit
MVAFIEDGVTAHTAGEPPDEDAVDVATRLRSQVQSAVGALRSQLPEAFPRWQQRRCYAARAATTDRPH